MASFAIKRLAAVEIAPDASHQHEFNAGRLRRELGFPLGKTEGTLNLLVQADGRPVVLDGTFTLYDARADHPTRSEYRLYYQVPGLLEAARPDDLLVLYRDSATSLLGIVARPGTALEHQLQKLLGLGDYRGLERLIFRTVSAIDPIAGVDLAETLLPFSSSDVLTSQVRRTALFARAVEGQFVPSTKDMASAGRDLSVAAWGTGLSSDEFVSRGLEAESELYFAIEKEVGTRSLQALLREGAPDLNEVLSWGLRIQQSRKARRGYSLQHHFGFLLEREGIPFSSQARTEGNETPDFLIPSAAAYHDPTFPESGLRMVACKSTVRERWGQILKEAQRITEKYLLTLDGDLTNDALRSMHAARLRLFMPSETISSNYPAGVTSIQIGSVADLLVCLRSALARRAT